MSHVVNWTQDIFVNGKLIAQIPRQHTVGEKRTDRVFTPSLTYKTSHRTFTPQGWITN